MTTKLQIVPHKIWHHSKVKFLNTSVIYKNIDLQLAMDTNFGSLGSKLALNLSSDILYLLGLLLMKALIMTLLPRQMSKLPSLIITIKR